MKVINISVSVNTSGDNTLVAAVTGATIHVVGYVLVAAGTVNVTFKSDVGGGATNLTGAMPMAANGSLIAPVSPRTPAGHHDGWFAAGAGLALNLNLSAGVAVTGHLSYTVKPA